jgi:hypothetical protein
MGAVLLASARANYCHAFGQMLYKFVAACRGLWKEDGKNHMIGRGEFVRLMFVVRNV